MRSFGEHVGKALGSAFNKPRQNIGAGQRPMRAEPEPQPISNARARQRTVTKTALGENEGNSARRQAYLRRSSQERCACGGAPRVLRNSGRILRGGSSGRRRHVDAE